MIRLPRPIHCSFASPAPGMRVGRVFCCMPTYGQVNPDSLRQFWFSPSKPGDKAWGKISYLTHGTSLLASCFNGLWAEALNLQLQGKDITHFAMLHPDIIPEDGWLDKLLDALEEAGPDCDVMAAVVPLKDPCGVTSTAIDDPTDEFKVFRRLTMANVCALPEIFSAADCGYPDKFLLANTGCWVCHLTRPWCRATDENGDLRAYFTIRDRIHVEADGTCRPRVSSEDWNFSRMLGALGAKVMCTRRISLTHMGAMPYPMPTDKLVVQKAEPWGEWQHDEATAEKHGNRAMGRAA